MRRALRFTALSAMSATLIAVAALPAVAAPLVAPGPDGAPVTADTWHHRTATRPVAMNPWAHFRIQQAVVRERSKGIQALPPAPEGFHISGYSTWVPEDMTPAEVAALLAQASLLKDSTPFAPGSGPNSTERMGEWSNWNPTVVAGTPRAYAVLQLANYGWGLDQWPYLDRMWWHESGWDVKTTDGQQGTGYGELDPSKTWGIPQANPASKMASAGADWATNPETQIRWGLGYIKSSYGSPAQAWEAWRARAATGSYGWY